jgi:hypothetical protein
MPTYYRPPSPEEDPDRDFRCTIIGSCPSRNAALLRRTGDGEYDGSAVCPEHADRLSFEDHLQW